ncbi:sensor histidine kinase [Streptomyces catenulae]|uniref:histidine kinase n=1 Tax=Streptomyces catenulae TaxID=66875 RepID=A0ABV2YUS7_9ACTN
MQGRFKRDGTEPSQARQGREAAAEPEPRGGTDRASSPQRAQGGGPANTPAPSDRSDRGGGDADRGPAKEQSGPGGPGSRVALRNWRISTRLISLLALPVVAATSLGAIRIQDSMENIEQLDKMKMLTDMTRQATELAGALQVERDKSAGPLAGSGNAKDDANVVAPREATDRARISFNQGTGDIQGVDATMTGVRATVLEIGRQLNTLNEIRSSAYKDEGNAARTISNYNQLIDSLLSLSQDMAQATSNPEMIRATRALAAFSSAKEYASMQRALVSAGLAHKGGPQLSANDRLAGRTAEDDEKAARDRFSQIYANNAGALTRGLDGNNDEIKAAVAFAHRAFASSSGIRSQDYKYLDWYDSDTVKIDEMSRIETSLLTEMEQKSRELRNAATQEAIINGALIFLVLGVSLVGAFVVARSMVRSLRRLQDTAQKVAQERLPELVKQLSDTDPQDVDTSVESVGVHSRDEIGRVAAAFDDVHREAVRLASEQALLRGNVNAMFTNLSRRSQGLIQRQLSLISELESREADPDQLSSLFKLDHLATRMRRNGENLLVLAGEEPGRRWTRPVPLVDVLRAAASEVEQYERIELSAVPQTEVAGRVVNDLVHLLAELLENATSFSSPQTKVKVTGHALPDGRVLVEIHDTGIGLSPEDLSSINERLASPPTVDVSVSRRMGLFVVGRLSLRHGIRIQLRPSDSGGTTALVMLPVDVAQGGKKPAPSTAKSHASEGGTGAGPGSGSGGTSRLAGLQPRGQVGAGPGGAGRPALPGRGGPGGAGRTAPGGPGGFGGPVPSGGPTAQPPAAPDASPRGTARPANAPADGGRPALPTRHVQRGEAPTETSGATPTVAPPTGAPDRDGRPQLPTRGPAAELTGSPAEAAPVADSPQPGTSWGVRRDRGATDDWPLAPREPQDTPRGHEEPETTGAFERPAPPETTGTFERPAPPETTGTFERPAPPETTGTFERPVAPGMTGGPGDTTAFARPDFNGPPPGTPRAAAEAPGDTGGFPAPGAPAPEHFGQTASGLPVRDAGRPDASRPAPQESGAEAASLFGVAPEAPHPTGQVPAQPSPEIAPEPAPSADWLGGDPSTGTGGGGTPIFDTIESSWFHTPEAAAAGVEPQPSVTAEVPQPQAPQAPQPADAPDATPAGGFDTTGWGSSPNDETWRQAEQIRQPAAGGVTTSGLPRRVPRANLVAGTAQQQPAQSGPQVSRAPSDVRGRLTSLRRGIQQGRQAGGDTGQHGVVDPTHQQER